MNYHCVDYLSCQAIHECLKTTNIIDWDHPPVFEAIHGRLIPELKQILIDKGCNITKDDICYQMWMPLEAASRIIVEYVKSVNLGIYITLMFRSDRI